jgi:hypothetical protein
MAMTQHQPPPAGPVGGNARTAIGAILTVIVAAVGGTAFLLNKSHQTPTSPETQTPAVTQPASAGDKSGHGEPPPTGKIDKSTKPKPPPPDPG